ncbi:MAG: Do family serine endopeptidase [Rhodothermia bacterium]|nr:Do family serine endopeptidase [Rhodothermia bacterium]
MSLKGKASIAVIVVVTFLAGVLTTTLGTNIFGVADRVGSDLQASTSTSSEERPDLPDASPFEEVFIGVAESVNPAVVQIRSERVSENRMNEIHPFFEGTPFEDFFDQQPREFRSNALGSGVIVRSDGYIITNNHVIQNAEELEVKLYGGDYYDAEVVGTDPNSDLAVIKIDGSDFPTIPYGSINNIRIGQWVMAFGSPLSEDLGNTVTAGIVSGLGRTSLALSRLNTFSSFIQTDAAINPGNSGGPLVNLRGELIGINSAIFSRSGGYQGVGFAIPVDVVDNVTTQLIDDGVVKRAFLGVSFGPVSPALADAFGVPRGAAQVESVTEGSAAEEADLRSGDIITAIDGYQLKDYNQLRTIIGNKLPGATVKLDIVRDGDVKELAVKLGERDEDAIAGAINGGTESDEPSEMNRLGIEIRDLTASLRRSLQLDDESIQGVVVSSIDESSDAYREADLRRGDIIVELDKKEVTSVSDFERLYSDLDGGDHFLVRVMRPARGATRSFITALVKPE